MHGVPAEDKHRDAKTCAGVGDGLQRLSVTAKPHNVHIYLKGSPLYPHPYGLARPT